MFKVVACGRVATAPKQEQVGKHAVYKWRVAVPDPRGGEPTYLTVVRSGEEVGHDPR